jgi:hypothetical protein
VFLAHPDRDDPDATPAALKVYRVDVGDDSIGVEAEAVFRAAGEHVVELLDLTVSPDGSPALIMQRLGGMSLARLLSERERLEPGEATTILAPLCGAVRRMHDAGVTHGAIRADAVLFDANGAPVWTSFGSASLFERDLSIAALDAHPAALADRAAFGALTTLVLDRVSVDATPVRAAVEELTDHAGLTAVADALFAWGAPIAVGLTPDSVPTSRVPGRVLTAVPVDDRPRGLFARLAPEFDALLSVGGAVALASRLRAALGRVRARVWIVAAVAVVALIAAVALVPQGSSDAAPEIGAVAPSDDPVTLARGDSVITGDDPLPAAIALLVERDRCIAELSVLCLDVVAQDGSAALASDRELIEELRAGAGAPALAPTPARNDLTLVERLGDSALVAIAGTTPASLLLMKGEAGWRIRDYLE